MSYCPAGGSKQGWTSPFTWSRMFNSLATTALNAAAASAEQPNVGIFYETQADQSLMVAATIYNPDMAPQGAASWATWCESAAAWPMRFRSGDYAIELRKGGAVLAQRTFTVDFRSEYASHGGTHGGGERGDEPPFPPEPSPQADVTFIMPWVAGADTVVLVHKGQVLDQRSVSANAPTVKITNPAGAANWPAGTTQTLAWTGQDLDGDALTYSVLYSIDGGVNWALVADHITAQFHEFRGRFVGGWRDTRFRVVANDGIDTGYDETDGPIACLTRRRLRSSATPANGQDFAPGELVVMQGIATDMEDGTLPESALEWSSDKQGVLGSGPSLPVNTLQPGPHLIKLTATDSQGRKPPALGRHLHRPSHLDASDLEVAGNTCWPVKKRRTPKDPHGCSPARVERWSMVIPERSLQQLFSTAGLPLPVFRASPGPSASRTASPRRRGSGRLRRDTAPAPDERHRPARPHR